jgi:hypothetical protein
MRLRPPSSPGVAGVPLPIDTRMHSHDDGLGTPASRGLVVVLGTRQATALPSFSAKAVGRGGNRTSPSTNLASHLRTRR